MSQKLTYTICSAVSFLFSISFYVFAEFFTKITFPQAEGYAIELGNAMRYEGCVYFSCIVNAISLAQFNGRV